MKQLSLFIVLIMSQLQLAQSQSIVWALPAGGIDPDGSFDVISDAAGGAIFTGAFSGTATIDGQTITSNGSSDIILGRLDPTGNLSWHFTAGGPGADGGHQVATDFMGNVIIAGEFENTITIGGTTLTSQGGQDIFVAKYDPNSSTILWAISAGGPAEDDINSIETSSTGDIYVTGSFMGTAFFGPAAVVSAGGSDVFISRITSAGAFFWTSQAGGSMDANCRGLAINTSNEVFVTGFFQGTASFGPSTFTSNNGSKDIFGALLGSSGQFLWAFKVGGPENDGAYEATVDAFNDFYFTGNFKNTAVFGPYILNSFGDDDVFVAKVNSSGFFIWAHNAGGTNEDKGYALSIDNTGSLFVTGSFEGTADFDSQTIISAGDRDVFMASYNSAGSLNLIERAGGPGFDRGYGIVKRYGLAYVTGVFEQTADFGSNIITSQGSSDLFVFKFDEPLSIAEASGSNINIYPSPFVHYCYIESSSIDLSEAELQLFDMTGRKVQISSEVSDGKIKIDSNGLGNGIYQLIIMVDDSVYSKKVCINKF